MKNFSDTIGTILEARQDYDSEVLLRSEITAYINKVKKSLPADVQKVIYLTQKYNLDSAAKIDQIRLANKSKLKDLVDVLGVPQADLEDIWNLLKQIKNNYKLLPQYMSKSEREAIEAGQLSVDDLTIDLKTEQGRNAAAKMYVPLVIKIVNQLNGDPRLSRADKISVGMMALADAINKWKPVPEKPGDKVVPFKTYAGYQIRFAILNAMDEHGYAVSGTNWSAAKAGNLSSMSIDNLLGGEMDADHFGALGVEDKPDKNDETKWQKVFKMLAQKFSQRDLDIFYRYFGVNGYKREKAKDIAKSHNMSPANINNGVLKNILKFIKSNKQIMNILQDIQDIYTECLLRDMVNFSRTQILDGFITDHVYILLEELNPWRSKAAFDNALQRSMKSVADPCIQEILDSGFEAADNNIKTHKAHILQFLRSMYPTTQFNMYTDMDLIEKMMEVHDAYQKYKK